MEMTDLYENEEALDKLIDDVLGGMDEETLLREHKKIMKADFEKFYTPLTKEECDHPKMIIDYMLKSFHDIAIIGCANVSIKLEDFMEDENLLRLRIIDHNNDIEILLPYAELTSYHKLYSYLDNITSDEDFWKVGDTYYNDREVAYSFVMLTTLDCICNYNI